MASCDEMRGMSSIPAVKPEAASVAASSIPLNAVSPAGSEKGEGGQPRYAQVARELRRAIATGIYPVGAHLPTEHQLCEQFQVSRVTAREAVRILAAPL